MMPSDPIWDDLFHGCAWQAFIEEARERQGWPDGTAVKRRAYQFYEQRLNEKDKEPVP